MLSPALADTSKVMSFNYDNSSSILLLNLAGGSVVNFPAKYSKLENPNRIYFDINDSVLIGAKQNLVFEKSPIKEVKLAQFSTNPNIVRVVITLEESFDSSKIKLINSNGNIIVQLEPPKIKNDYFNPIYDDNPAYNPYSSIVVNSLVTQRIETIEPSKSSINVVSDINKAFDVKKAEEKEEKKIEESVISVDISSILKLRTKYFVNGYYVKNGGLLVSGLGQLTVGKVFKLESPNRVVVDLPNSYVDRKIRNRELSLCSDGSCKDTAKIGQFEFNKARIVITTDTPDKYIPVYSSDSQSLLLINADKLNHTSLSTTVANLQKVYVKKINSKTTEMILSFTAPIIHSTIKDEKSLNLYLFNVKSYNEPEIMKTLNGSTFKSLTFSLLPQIGIKGELKINKDDAIQIAQGLDGKAIKITLTKGASSKDIPEETLFIEQPKQIPVKNKVVIDPGHGGSDYGAIRDGINEKDITLDVSMRVATMLKAKGYKVAMTRNDDRYLELQERCDISETENPEIFVSIHVNSAVATEPYGIETHYYHDRSKKLAEVIQKHMVKNIDSKNRGILKSKFYVINHTDVPAVLVEMGFLSNPQERSQIISEKRKQATAKAIADGIMEYLKK